MTRPVINPVTLIKVVRATVIEKGSAVIQSRTTKTVTRSDSSVLSKNFLVDLPSLGTSSTRRAAGGY